MTFCWRVHISQSDANGRTVDAAINFIQIVILLLCSISHTHVSYQNIAKTTCSTTETAKRCSAPSFEPSAIETVVGILFEPKVDATEKSRVGVVISTPVVGAVIISARNSCQVALLLHTSIRRRDSSVDSYGKILVEDIQSTCSLCNQPGATPRHDLCGDVEGVFAETLRAKACIGGES